jgi:hypothetical protein
MDKETIKRLIDRVRVAEAELYVIRTTLVAEYVRMGAILPELKSQVVAAYTCGGLLEAVKLYRDHIPQGLAECKRDIEMILAEAGFQRG